MLIILLIIVLCITFVIMYIYEAITDKVKRVREGKEYANLPKKVLLMYVLNSPVYSEQYHDLRQVIPDDRAASIAIKRMLMDRKILKYRKEKL